MKEVRAPNPARQIRLAYLVSRYPAISHTFILREVRQLRALGFEIHVASINSPDRGVGLLTAEEREETASTYYVKAHGPKGALIAHLAILFSSPLSYLGGMMFALRLGGTDVRGVVYGLLYFVEAVMIGRWMKGKDLSHLHVHFATPASNVALIASRVYSITYSITVHGPDEFYDVSQYRLAEKIRGASFLCCIGVYARSQLMKLSPASEWRKFEISPLGVDPAAFAPRPFRERASRFELICVGRLVPAKGQHVLIAALDRLVREGRPLRLRLVGDGPDRASLEKMADERGLRDHVVFEGAVNQDRIRALYGQADLFVLASFAEGIPVVLMEAMAMEIPCVTTFITGIPELIRDGIDGLLIQPSDDEGLSKAIARLMDDAKLRRSLGEKGRERVREKYDLQRNTARLATIFQRRLGVGIANVEQTCGLFRVWREHHSEQTKVCSTFSEGRMKKLLILILICVGLLISVIKGTHTDFLSNQTSSGLLRLTTKSGEQSEVKFQVESAVTVADVSRIGVNLGTWTSWGAEQLSSNVLKNPGFEGLIDRALVIVKRAGMQRFTDDTDWLAREDGFWAGAQFEVRTGQSAGQKGALADSRRASNDGLPEYITLGVAPILNPGDVVILTRLADAALPSQWWIPRESNRLVTVETLNRRPGTPGTRSIGLKPVPGRSAEIISYLDAIGDRAGKLLPIRGPWHLSFWSRSKDAKATLTIEFRRPGSPAFLSRTISPRKEWSLTTFEFSPDDRGPAGTLELHFRASGNSGGVLLDDVDLGPNHSEPFPFREEVVQALKQLRPGFIRDWQGQLGDTLENRLAAPFARRSSRYRPGTDTDFGYSLPDFLDLCVLVGANPWIVIPPTFSDEELIGLGRFLASRSGRDGFTETVIEFGNENWNQLFRPAGIPEPRAHGEAAERAFQKVREGAGSALPLRTVINGQHANPEYALRFAQHAPSADILALAPYFQPSLSAGLSRDERMAGLFSGDENRLGDSAVGARALGKELAVYEVNLHTIEGDAPPEERDPVTAGAAAGSAVAKVILDALALGTRRQCIYTFAGYDTWLPNRSGFAKLWGIVRDLGDTKRFRPTGLAVVMLNQAVAGDLVRAVNLSGTAATDVSLYPFRSREGWSAAVVSSSPDEREVSISFPASQGELPPTRILRLEASAPWATNEDGNDVQIVEEKITAVGTTVSFRMPAYGLVVLLP